MTGGLPQKVWTAACRVVCSDRQTTAKSMDCKHAEWSGVTGGLPQKVSVLRRIKARFPSPGVLTPEVSRVGGNVRDPSGVPVGAVLP